MGKLAALLVGFGGPVSREEVRPFLESVAAGAGVPPSRLEEAARHYERIGASPYKAMTERQRSAAERELAARGIRVPVLAAYRHSEPSIAGALTGLKEKGFDGAAVFVLTPFRCPISYGRYVAAVEQALETLKGGVRLRYTPPFHADQGFTEAVCARVRRIAPAPDDRTFVLFTAHSIPSSAAGAGRYAAEFSRSARRIAQRLGLKRWVIAYQSRSGRPQDPWLGPTVDEAIGAIPPSFKRLVIVSTGFLVDNVEILYDLDIKARQTAESRGLVYARAATVADEPGFVRLVSDRLAGALNTLGASSRT